MGFSIGVKDIIDILLVAILLYQAYRLLKKTGAVNIFIGILTFVIIWFLVSFVFKMELLGGIMDRLMSVGAFGVVVLFQDEIRRFFSCRKYQKRERSRYNCSEHHCSYCDYLLCNCHIIQISDLYHEIL